ncbi:MAG: ferrous iron transport protein B, partial [Planctomycetota bacterium]|nr:ferrous iron transport protein B [Planctomycetota bacterium]
MPHKLTIGFVGNPNSGKTTLFNAFTGANLKVANWPGVTVDRVEGAIRQHNLNIRLVDLPGLYSLTSYSMEERVSRQFILSEEIDLIINVVDASNLERGLYLTLQLLELGKPVVIALNMIDIVEKRGEEIDLHRLPEMLGVPAIPVSAKKKTGLQILMHAAAHHADHYWPEHLVHNHTPATQQQRLLHKHLTMVYSDDLEKRITAVSQSLRENYVGLANYRWLAIKILENDPEVRGKYPLALAQGEVESCESEIIRQKFSFIEEIVREVLLRGEIDITTDRVDRILTHRWLGLPIFLVVMGLVFCLTFALGDWVKGYFEIGIDWFSNLAATGLADAGVGVVLTSLIVDGGVAGVGAILTFLPNIFILFLALAFLEDSGYMARVAYIMEDIMSRLGLSGQAFIPMVLGFGCTVPAIMASRNLKAGRDRFKVMLITPFMSCSARLPIYVMFAEMFFPDNAMLVTYSIYLIGIVVALIVAYVSSLFDRLDQRNHLLIELPEYKSPTFTTIAIYVYEKVKDYISKAGTTIFLVSLVMWFLLNFGAAGFATELPESYGASLGRALVPFLLPLGLGTWQIAVALVAGLSAKEMVV